ncbi:MAG: aldehyde dehydrogenase family protein [Phycisphaerales bacterium]|nr:aldehyde dehydrogenase family protein [Phycisphaerales bacterium]
MNHEKILINGAWETDPSEASFTPENPATGEELDRSYPVSSKATLARLASHAANAAKALNHCDPEQIAAFLDNHASNIDSRREEISSLCHRETGLPTKPRLQQVEMDRTVDQLRQAAACARDRSWCQPRIDTKLDLRSVYEPLGGGVLVIGPNNFPLAYNGIAGGDFAAAIAARNPVIAKAHPLHPGTTKMLAECAHDAAKQAGLPAGSVQMFYNCEPEDGLSLIRMPEISAVGFTGSRPAGLSMKQAADETGTPIYLELSSVNPMFLLPGAIEERGEDIADLIADSMLAASGQQCTCPGLLIVRDSHATDHLIGRLRSRLAGAPHQVMLSSGGVRHLHESVQAIEALGADRLIGGAPVEGNAARYEHTLLRTEADHFLANSDEMQNEMFGVAALIIVCDRDEQLIECARSLEGNLTGTLHLASDTRDDELARAVSAVLRNRVGRLIHDAVPTGVSVNAATVHGGPFPATGHPGFTAVGMPTTIHRFAALRCYDRVRGAFLPPELQDTPPTPSMRRMIDGVWRTGIVERA